MSGETIQGLPSNAARTAILVEGGGATAGIPAALGTAAMAASMPITIATDDTVMGPITASAWTSGNGSINALLKAIATAAISTNPVLTYRSDSFVNITTKTTTVVKSGAGTLTRIIITPGTTDTLTIYDNTSAAGTKIATITVGATANDSIEFGCAFATGLTVVSGGGTAGDYTVIYR